MPYVLWNSALRRASRLCGTAIMKYLGGGSSHSTLMFAALMIAPHFAVSALRYPLSSAGVEGLPTTPIASKLCFIDGCASAKSTSSWTFFTISVGVFTGRKMAYQEDTSNSDNPVSAIVGMSGAKGERVFDVTASARSAPFWACSHVPV